MFVTTITLLVCISTPTSRHLHIYWLLTFHNFTILLYDYHLSQIVLMATNYSRSDNGCIKSTVDVYTIHILSV